jgi:hypothetical protein
MRRDPHTGAPDFFGFARDYLPAFYAFATLDMMRQAINAATPAINTTAPEPLTEDQLQTLYSLR